MAEKMFVRRLSVISGAVLVGLLGVPAPSAAQFQATLVASGFDRPIAFVQSPVDPSVQVVAEQGGHVRVLVNGVVQPTDYLDISAAVLAQDERGLLGFAFSPDYATTGRVFVNFIDLSSNTVVARFTRSASNPLRADPASRVDLVWPGGLPYIVQPFSNHNGGNLAFGPDGYLYIGMGDGGSGNDPLNNAQNPLSLLGKMLRIDVDVPVSDPEGYDVPPDNPFVGEPGVLGEIWAFGLRNPWRWSFDDPALGGTGALVIGDVGQGAREEIDYEPAGAGGRNYGWRNREGSLDNVTSLPPFSLPLVDPLYDYPRTQGSCVTGGIVYRGTALGPGMYGRYVFADIGTGRLWSLGLEIDPVTGEASMANIREHTQAPGAGVRPWVSFGVNAAGELFGLAYDGRLLRFDPLPPGSVENEPGDFDGDSKADITVYSPSTGTWSVLQSASGYLAGADYTWGVSTDVPVAGDYDGDGLTDIAVYRPVNGVWYILRSSSGFSAWSVHGWGLAGDVPVPADYDADGRVDIAVYRPSSGFWFVLTSASNFTAPLFYSWGLPGDVPVPADYDGDGRADIAAFRPSTGLWFILKSSSGYTGADVHAWGLTGDVPIPGDYDGDGRSDVAVYRPSLGYWFVLTSASGFTNWWVFSWGAPGDLAVPADFDGDSVTDVAVYRPSAGAWYILKSSTGFVSAAVYLWGTSTDVPISGKIP